MTSKEGDETLFRESRDQSRKFLRRHRGGKKGSISKRILQIDENGCRIQINSLFESLLLVQKEFFLDKEINIDIKLLISTKHWQDMREDRENY